MATLDPHMAHPAQFADTQPNVRAPTTPPPPTQLAQIKRDARPYLIGAGVGVGVALAAVALTSRKRSRSYSLFAEPKSQVIAGLAKIALLAVGRTLLRRAFTHAVEKAVAEPAEAT
jgi:hypothetical protein